MKKITLIICAALMSAGMFPLMANSAAGITEITENDSVKPESSEVTVNLPGNQDNALLPGAENALVADHNADANAISQFSDTELKSREMVEIYEKGISDARVLYTGHKSAGLSTLVSSSLVLPIGLISAADHSSAGFKETFNEIGDPVLKSNPAYMKGFSEEALKMRRKSVRKNLIIGAALQAIIVTSVGSLMLNSNNKVGMSGF